jgi:protein phosphatase
MGGYVGGEVASQLAVATISNFLEPRLSHLVLDGWSQSQEEALLRESIQLAQHGILQAAEATPELEGMGTTVVLLRLSPLPKPQVLLLHVGDSRGYLLRDGAIRGLSTDHSLMERYVRAGAMTRDEIEFHPQRHVLTRALGTRQAEPDLSVHPLEPGDQLLLCSDGLTTMLSDARIAEIWNAYRCSSRAVCQALVAEANARGGADNITVIVVEESRDDPSRTE